jgi:hypothetical protein
MIRMAAFDRAAESCLMIVALLALGALVGGCAGVIAASPVIGFAAGTFASVLWLINRAWKKRTAAQPNVDSDNAYVVLGVKRQATPHEIRTAYRKLLAKYHPDAVPLDRREHAARVSQKIERAYELLSHPEKRFQYNHWLEREFSTGELPFTFDEAYERVKDEDKHPLYDFYDTLYPRPRQVDDAGTEQQANTSPRASAGGETVDPVIVEVPESVREALTEPLPAREPQVEPPSGTLAPAATGPEPGNVITCRRCGYSSADTAGYSLVFCPQCGSRLEQLPDER